MKKIFIMFLIVITIILAFSMSAYAEYIEPLPEQPSELPCIFIGGADYEFGTVYVLYYSNIPIRLENYRKLVSGMYVWDVVYSQGIEFVRYQQVEGSSEWTYQGRYSFDEDTIRAQVEYVVYTNRYIGEAFVDLEVEEYNNSFFGLDFDYSGFFGNLKVQLGKKEESGTYKTIKEWQYPKGSGHVSIPASEIPQGNKGEYRITVYDGDIIIKQYPYILEVGESPYCEINYPVNGQSYNYYPNVNIRYKDMGKLYLYINGEMYKKIQTKDREGIEVIDGNNDLFDVGMNTVSVKDSNGQVVATVQYEVMREGLDPNEGLPEYEAESWVQELFYKIMDEYSLFFEYVRGIYGFLPVEIVGLVVIIMMLAVVLWFTGRK